MSIAFGAKTGRNDNYAGIVKVSTNAFVGPGSYEAPSQLRTGNGAVASDAVSYAAFGSSAARTFSDMENKGGTGVTVGPGAYDLLPTDVYSQSPQRGVSSTGGSMESSFQASSLGSPNRPRVHKGKVRTTSGGPSYDATATGTNNDEGEVEVDGTWFDGHRPRSVVGPGPGSYDLRGGGVAWGKGKAPVLRPAAGPASGAAGTSISSGNGGVSWMRVPCAPSIPGRGQDLGYEEGTSGELVMVRPAPGYSGNFRDGPGPSDYRAEQPKLNGHAVDWTRSAPRPQGPPGGPKETLHRPGPKPGAGGFANGGFAASMAAAEAEDDANYQRLATSQPRPSSMFLASGRSQSASSANKGSSSSPMAAAGPASPSSPSSSSSSRQQQRPGPGYYEHTSTLKAIPKGSWPEQLQNFGSSSQRSMGSSVSEQHGMVARPGPGAYSPKTSVFPSQPSGANPQSRRLADEPVGFGSTAFDRGAALMPRPQSSAGPGSYELGGLAQDILHKQASQQTANRDFGSSGPRFKNAETKPLEASRPGPATYFLSSEDEDSLAATSYPGELQTTPLRAISANNHQARRSSHHSRGAASSSSSSHGGGGMSLQLGSRAAALMAQRDLGLLNGSIPMGTRATMPSSASSSSSSARISAGIRRSTPARVAMKSMKSAAGSGLLKGSALRLSDHQGQAAANKLSAPFRTTPRAGTAIGVVGDAQDPALVRRARLGASGGGHGHGVAADNRAQPPLSQNTVKSGSGKGRSATDSRNAFVEPLTETESAPLATSSVALAASNPKSYCLQSGVPARVAGADLGRSSERWRSSGLHDDDLAMVGPGSYPVPSTFGQVGGSLGLVQRSTSGVMQSRAGRSSLGGLNSSQGEMPGPGAYNPIGPNGTMVRSTFNAAITVASSARPH